MALPKLSIVIAVYDMTREAARTLTSLTAAYQEGVNEDDYEVLVVENPSPSCLTRAQVESYGVNFRYHRADQPSPSPAAILNAAARRAEGELLLILVNGARLLSPGVLRNVFDAARLHPRPLVAFHGLHLGAEQQSVALANNRYDKAIEDRLLGNIDWPRNGYAMFGNSVFAASSAAGWFAPMAESNCVALPKASFLTLGGFDERFATPGGGFVNLEFYERALALPRHQLFHVLGEGTFHQVHGGASTNAMEPVEAIFHEEYARLKGRRWSMPRSPEPRYLGSIKTPAVKKLDLSARRRHRQKQIREPDYVARRLDGLLDGSRKDFDKGLITRPIVFVHGMHRSGTSALARGFAEIGFEVPQPVIGKSMSNPDGHYESLPVVMLNERILRTVGSAWHHTTPLPDAWAEWPAIAKYVQAARHLLADAGALGTADASPSSATPVVIKDPRLARVWPVWSRALEPMPGPVHHLVIIRSPAAVARSLQRRDATCFQHGLLLWARYACELFSHLEGVPFGLVRYEVLVSADGARELAQGLSGSGLNFLAADRVARMLSVFHHQPPHKPARAAPWFQRVYENLFSDSSRDAALAMMRERLEAGGRVWGAYIRSLEQEHVI